MTFTPPKKRTHGLCTCKLGTVNYIGHMPDCPALYPLQPQPGDHPAEVAHASAERRWEACEAERIAAVERADNLSDANRLLAIRIQHLEARLKDYERSAVLTNDHQSRALRMGQQQGRADLAADLLNSDDLGDDVRAYLRTIANDDH